MGLKIGGQIEKIDGRELTYTDFVKNYFEKNEPVVLKGLMDDWRACKDWVFDNGKPNLLLFKNNFGKSQVQVADCSCREFTDQKRVEMSVSEFVDQWLKISSKESCSGSGQVNNGPAVLYLKDWHFVKEYPEYTAYETPQFFLDDWLNFYLDNYSMHRDPDPHKEINDICCSDYRFAYMGAKGTWTPFHADVFRSYSWSANVCGKKYWLFLSPSQCHLAFDRHMKSSVYDVFDDIDQKKFPGFEKAIWLECTQEQNEIVFVPSGWYHQVHNLEDTISINHNWFNGFNLSWVWDLLLRDYHEAREYIEDIKDICDDFEGLCQRNLAVNTGMNFYDFFIFMVHFSLANVVLLDYLARNCGNPLDSSSLTVPHLVLNLKSIREIALRMKSVVVPPRSCAVSLDIFQIMEDSAFLALCKVLARTYDAIHKEQKQSYDIRVNDFLGLDCLKGSSSELHTPENLVNFIDSTFSRLSGLSSG
ncbi:Cupin-like domain 8 [Dillenia turbinata]|uniref:Cupin-like domain 8 n=1 Tax=Dillenia turbinata TaxID=194707 RepID=A0AAN8Z4T5_9MAGN